MWPWDPDWTWTYFFFFTPYGLALAFVLGALLWLFPPVALVMMFVVPYSVGRSLRDARLAQEQKRQDQR